MTARTDRPIDPAEVATLVEEGILVRPAVLPPAEAHELANAISRLAMDELRNLGTTPIRGNGYYVRELMWKDERFHPYVRWPETILLARAMLGPQVRVALDARVAGRRDEVSLEWHIHTPPPPADAPWASAAQTMACLVYLDDVGPDEGALAVLPGSHRERWTEADAQRAEAQGLARQVLPRRGDLVIMHGNLWHRTLPTAPERGARRVLFVGYGPAWMTLDADVAGQPPGVGRKLDEIAWPPDEVPDEDEQRDLLGRFLW